MKINLREGALRISASTAQPLPLNDTQPFCGLWADELRELGT
jgi:hypothetical protein